MADPELYDTNLKIQYLDSKKKILVLEKDLKDLKFKLNQSDSIRSQKRIDKIFGKYDVNLNFDEIKKLVHQLIDKIIIHHLKDVKKIMIEIKYAGFDEKSTFISTDLKLSSFDNIYHIENSSFNESDILNYYNLIYPKFKSRYKTKNEIIDVVKNNNRWYNKLDGLTYEEIIMEITRGEIKYKSKKNVLSPSITLGDDELYNFNIIT